MAKIEQRDIEKLFGRKIATYDIRFPNYKAPLKFDLYDGFAYCENYNGHEYTLDYPKLELVKQAKELSDDVIRVINTMSKEPHIETVDDITVTHVMIAFKHNMTKDGVTIKPGNKKKAE